MDSYLSRNNTYYSFPPLNTITSSNVRNHPNSNGQNDTNSILKEIKKLLSSVDKKMDSLNTNLKSLNTNVNSLNTRIGSIENVVKNAKIDIINEKIKKKAPSSPGNSAYSENVILPKKLEKVTGIYRRRNE